VPCGGQTGGCLKFGPDGYLYIATRLQPASPTRSNRTNLENAGGKILRIDVDPSDAGKKLQHSVGTTHLRC